MQLSQRLGSLKASKTLAITARAAAMRAQGVKVIGFGAGEPDFDTPQFIKDGAAAAMASGQTRYTATEGTLVLREAICRKFLLENGLHYQPDQILVSCGAKHSLFNAMAALFDPGDQVVVPAPYWVSYLPQLRFLGVEPVVVESRAQGGFKLTAEALRSVVGPATRGLILNDPCNPTGVAYTGDELQSIAQVALETGLWVISDEIYEHLVYDGHRHLSIASVSPEMAERTVVINGVSKAYAMTGWRIGYAAGPKPVLAAMGRFQGHITSCACSVAQAAACTALTGDHGFLNEWVAQFDQRRKVMVQMLNEIPGVSCRMPQGAFYVFPSIEGLLGRHHLGQRLGNSAEVAEFLLEEAHIATVCGSAFGAEGYLRLSYATSMEQIREGLDRFKAAVERLS